MAGRRYAGTITGECPVPLCEYATAGSWAMRRHLEEHADWRERLGPDYVRVLREVGVGERLRDRLVWEPVEKVRRRKAEEAG